MVKLSSKVLPPKLVQTFQKKSEAMVKKLVYGPQAQKNNEQAIKSGAAMNGIPALVQFLETFPALDGVLTDYEPLDSSLEHAQAYSRWLAAAAAAVTPLPCFSS